jgi:hypothetical protein
MFDAMSTVRTTVRQRPKANAEALTRRLKQVVAVAFSQLMPAYLGCHVAVVSAQCVPLVPNTFGRFIRMA